MEDLAAINLDHQVRGSIDILCHSMVAGRSQELAIGMFRYSGCEIPSKNEVVSQSISECPRHRWL
jgi:hypothetical protein